MEYLMVAASGSGTTFRAVADAVHRQREAGQDLGYEIAIVVSNNSAPGVFGQVAEVNKLYGWNIQTESIPKADYPGGPQERGMTLEQADHLGRLVDEYKPGAFVAL